MKIKISKEETSAHDGIRLVTGFLLCTLGLVILGSLFSDAFSSLIDFAGTETLWNITVGGSLLAVGLYVVFQKHEPGGLQIRITGGKGKSKSTSSTRKKKKKRRR